VLLQPRRRTAVRGGEEKDYMRTCVGFVCTNCTNMMKTCIVSTNMNGKNQDGIRDAYVVTLLV
jgi:hypothetical protein